MDETFIHDFELPSELCPYQECADHPMSVIDELRELEAAATPGPWRVSREDLARILGPDAGNYLGSTRHIGATATIDAALIVALRNHARALLDVAEAARTLRDVPKRYPDDSDWLPLHRALVQLDAEKGAKDE